MAKVFTPLLSGTARGGFGKFMIYQGAGSGFKAMKFNRAALGLKSLFVVIGSEYPNGFGMTHFGWSLFGYSNLAVDTLGRLLEFRSGTVASAEQEAQRTLFLAAVAAWNALTPSQKAVYDAMDYPRAMTGYNRFLRAQLA